MGGVFSSRRLSEYHEEFTVIDSSEQIMCFLCGWCSYTNKNEITNESGDQWIEYTCSKCHETWKDVATRVVPN